MAFVWNDMGAPSCTENNGGVETGSDAVSMICVCEEDLTHCSYWRKRQNDWGAPIVRRMIS
jgi:hypothetical protein